MAAGLKAAGMEDFLVIEKGCACDVAAHLYSLSFAQNADWTRLLATQSELQDYIIRVVDDLGLRPKIRFNTEMVRANWDEAAALWRATTRAGGVISARVLVSGIGALHVPSIPELSKAESFDGVSFHSARWRRDYDLTGKRVAMIGTGASAIQFVPQIASDVTQLHVVQRTAPWILPKLGREIGPMERWILHNVKGSRSLFRRWLYCTYEIRVLAFIGNRMLVEYAEKVARKHLEQQIADSELRLKLTPNYRIGCKRVLLADDYYPALTRANVELVTDAIAEIRAHSIATKDRREREIDAIIYGTGFDVARALRGLDVHGRGGRALADVWKEAIESYYGL
jgi:cation diffusion facilitator CzcD-associated flavoprotein CzcO